MSTGSVTDVTPETDAEAVSAQIADVFAAAGATGHLHAREVGVQGGPEVSVAADEPVVLASVFKILVLTAYARAVEDGTLDPESRGTVTARYRIGGVGTAGFLDDVEVSWRDLATLMMTMSDNAATDVIYHRLGREAVDRVITDLALDRTRLIGCCEDLFATIPGDLGVAPGEDLEAVLARATPETLGSLSMVDPLRTSASTPRDVTTLLNALWTDAAAPPAGAAAAREIMSRQIWPHRLSSGFPSDVQIAAKTGTVPSWRNEAGVVTYPDGRQYAVAVFTRADSFDPRLPSVDASIGEAGFAAVEHLRARTL
ncbi:beta-lactamase class A [Microbacterium resistens]|uniref:Beta-lactamase class A n=1 Tax=Microbacterium resistens TaxID=156977 RepID=A0ABU1SA54_9MICO|nr:serine hydrolase [Microbacterium resistens]MDR6865702.1 beta-lactamase class A [Microbacterium resistens]